jgi:hypothetical protein
MSERGRSSREIVRRILKKGRENERKKELEGKDRVRE